MTLDLNVDQVLDSWFIDGPTQLPDRTVLAIADRLDDVQQLGPRGLLGRIHVNRSVAQLGGATAVVLAAAVALNFVFNQPGGYGGPQPTPTSSAPGTAVPTLSPTPDPDLRTASPDPAPTVHVSTGAGVPLGWSSDGTRLLVQKRDGNLFVVHVDGSETQVADLSGLSRFLGSARPAGATISPDGSRVVFAGLTKIGGSCHNGALFAVDADGGPAEVLWVSQAATDGGIVRYPTFSPDGTQIAFADGYCDHNHSVWVMNADGSDAHQIVSDANGPLDGTHVSGLAWSPAGDRLALVVDEGTYTFATDGSDFSRASFTFEFCWPGRRC